MKAEPFFADTNLFLRYLTNDVPEQAGAVEALLRQAAQGEFALVTNSLVIAEIVWTLESYYGLSRPEIQQRVLAILNTPGLEIADREILVQTILRDTYAVDEAARSQDSPGDIVAGCEEIFHTQHILV